MSVRVLSLASTTSKATLGTRLVLIFLADAAHDDGVTWISQRELAAKTLMTEQSVREGLRRLEDAGEIELRKAQRGKRRINVYRVVVGAVAEVDYERLPFEVNEPFSRPQESRGRTNGYDRGLTDVTTAASGTSLARAGSLSDLERNENRKKDPPVGSPIPKKVNGKPVTVGELRDATEILEAFNEIAGHRFTASDWLAKIIMRLREHPEITPEQHRAVIAAAFLNPWWKDAPSPSVVYGNAGLFERTALGARDQLERSADIDGWFGRVRERLAREQDTIEGEATEVEA